MCLYCKDVIEAVEHTLLECSKWKDERDELMKVLKCPNTLCGITAAICENKEKWQAFNHFCKIVMHSKEELERETERERRDEEEEEEEGEES